MSYGEGVPPQTGFVALAAAIVGGILLSAVFLVEVWQRKVDPAENDVEKSRRDDIPDRSSIDREAPDVSAMPPVGGIATRINAVQPPWRAGNGQN